MLRRLVIRDFVLVDRLELDFEAGFGALTGETGAGKSILVDALAFADPNVLTPDWSGPAANALRFQPSFDLQGSSAAADWLREQDLDNDECLLLRRVVGSSGRSRAYLNGSPVTVQQLREVAESLVDIHGQHAHQSLLRGEAQRGLLDSHARLDPLLEEVSSAWRLWRSASSA